MGLREYRRKRDFAQTPEPRGEEHEESGQSFCVQKHAASRLHYDFRLELDGVLKSWAVPKGPSLDPADKRLAMHVEDHPVSYGDFEGIIPKGEYGGGTVVLWDRGTWTPTEDPHKGYREGRLKFRLQGQKLHGGWTLVRLGGRRPKDDGKGWLLIKERDERARPASEYSIVDARPESVATGRTLDQIAASADRIWHSNRAERTKTARTQRTRSAPVRAGFVAPELPGARKSALPKFIPPQLATFVSDAPRGDEWLHEMKFDGYRILARLEKRRVQLISRNGRDWTARFEDVVRALEALPARDALIDGEVAVLLANGTTSFQALQTLMSGASEGSLVYFAFDLLHLDGSDLTASALEDRKRVLRALIDAASQVHPTIRFSDHVVGAGPKFLQQACRLGLEGIISKRRDLPYSARRTRGWLKMKCVHEQEFVIGGFTEPQGSREGLGALLLGVYEKDHRLLYVGKVGTGFTGKTLRELRQRLRALEEPQSPFASRVTGVGKVHWVRPELVGEVVFAEWTGDGRLRHPSFKGLREDKPAKDVVREKPQPLSSAI